MNFGERLKQIRTAKGLTQPQFAQLAGIEQSYLSKLENDKSVPSAEMFSSILGGLEMDPASFLEGIDGEVLGTTLRHIPAVGRHTSTTVAAHTRRSKRWLFGSALAWLIGFALLLAANDGIVFSNWQYTYRSPGVILKGEAENVFETHKEILELRLLGKAITHEEMAQQLAAFQTTRARPLTVVWPSSRGNAYAEAIGNGQRRFELVRTDYARAPGNRVLQWLGAIVLVSGFIGLFIEWRLRRFTPKQP